MEMKIKSERNLLNELKNDVDKTGKKKIVILSGHFPLTYTREGVIEAIHKWGEFSLYTLELGLEVGKYAKSIGKEVKFIFFVDDHIYESISGFSSYQLSKKRRELYKKSNSNINKKYSKLMEKYGFNKNDIIRQNQKKSGRTKSLYFSEKILRASNLKIDNECAREYVAFIKDSEYFNKENDYIISFIPNRCKNNICLVALNIEIKGLSGSHIFMDSMAQLSTRKELFNFGRGITLRCD